MVVGVMGATVQLPVPGPQEVREETAAVEVAVIGWDAMQVDAPGATAVTGPMALMGPTGL